MAKAKSESLKKQRKKQWFSLIAPDVFKNIELGEVAAFEGKNLIGRVVELTYSALTENPKDMGKKFAVRITDFRNDKALTEPIKILYPESLVQRRAKKYKCRFLVVNQAVSKDKKNIVTKIHLLLRDKVPASVRGSLIKSTESFIKSRLESTDFVKLFEPNYLEMFCNEIKKELKTIYPIDRASFWKVLVA